MSPTVVGLTFVNNRTFGSGAEKSQSMITKRHG